MVKPLFPRVSASNDIIDILIQSHEMRLPHQEASCGHRWQLRRLEDDGGDMEVSESAGCLWHEACWIILSQSKSWSSMTTGSLGATRLQRNGHLQISLSYIVAILIKNIPDSGYQIRLTKILVSFGDNGVDHDDGSGDDGDFFVLVMVVICRIPSWCSSSLTFASRGQHWPTESVYPPGHPQTKWG